MGAGTLMQAWGTYGAMAFQKGALQYQANVDELNGRAADWAAEDALVRGEMAASDVRRRTRQIRGTQIASLAASNLDLTQGSPLAILEDTTYFGDLDEQTVRDNAQRESYSLKMQGLGYRSQAYLKRAEASTISPRMGAFSAILSGGGQMASTAYMAQRGR